MLYFQIADPVTGSLVQLSIKMQPIDDYQWHYNCTDLSIGLKGTLYSNYPLSSLKLFEVLF